MDEDLQYFDVIPNSKQILIRTLRDINRDSVFNRDDKSTWYKAEPSDAQWKIEEIIDSAQGKRIEKLYFEQWLRRK